jgi:hypothetical protein
MMRYSNTRRIERPVAEVFDFAAVHCYDNHPKWEDEVLEIRPITQGPIDVGSRAIMVRRDFGRTSETEYEVTAYEPDRLVAFRHNDPKMRFDIAFRFTPVGDATDLQVDVEAQPTGFLKVMEPMMRRRMPKISGRIMDRLKVLLEAHPAAA